MNYLIKKNCFSFFSASAACCPVVCFGHLLNRFRPRRSKTAKHALHTHFSAQPLLEMLLGFMNEVRVNAVSGGVDQVERDERPKGIVSENILISYNC